jgi:hypothetical protein
MFEEFKFKQVKLNKVVIMEKEEIIKEHLEERTQALLNVGKAFREAVEKENLTVGEQAFIIKSFDLDLIKLQLQRNLKDINPDDLKKAAKDIIG